MISCSPKGSGSNCDNVSDIDSGCNTTDTVCEVVVRIPSAGCPHDGLCRVSVSSVIPNEVALANAIDEYAKVLQSIAASDVSTQVKAGLAQASTGICNLVDVINPASSACAGIAKTASQALPFGFKQYETKVKLDALRKVTAKMDPWMYCPGASGHNCVARVFSTTTSFLLKSAIPKLAGNARLAQIAYDRTPATFDEWPKRCEPAIAKLCWRATPTPGMQQATRRTALCR